MNPQLIFAFNSSNAPLFGLELATFLGMIPNLISVAVLAALMTYLLYNPVKKILSDRAERVAGELRDAEDKNLSAGELKQKYEGKVKEIEQERAAIIEAARKEAKERQAAIMSEAKHEADSLKERAAKDIADEKVRFKDAVHAAIIDISTDMAAKIIEATIDKNTHNRLFAEALRELETTVLKPDAAAV